MKYISSLNEYFNNKVYHISNKDFDNFSLDFLLKGSGVNKQGKGIYLSENPENILKYYRKGKRNILYTILFKKTPLLINYDEIVSDEIYEHLEKIDDEYISMLCKPFNRNMRGKGLLDNLKNYDNNIENILCEHGIDGITYINDDGITNYCIFNLDILNIINKKQV